MAAPKIAVITGPTATGKTSLGIMLAGELNGEIVSADSMQIYRGMDIGTAKVRPDEMRSVPHHMIDVAEPSENWSVAKYVSEADRCVENILSRKKLPIIVGGTGLYIDSLIAGREFAGGDSSEAYRRELSQEYDEYGGDEMLKRLAAVDPDRAEILHPSDKKRIVRALEVYYLTGQTITAHDAETKKLPPKYAAAKIALSFESRDDLYARIDMRVDEMLRAGLFDEVRRLLSSGVPEKCTAMQAIGYKEVVSALRGDISEAEAADAIKRESRRYAKRQLTWLRRDKSVKWILWKTVPDFELARQCSTNYIRSLGLE